MDRALYQQYRPQKFKEVIGQDHIVSFLENAIEKNDIGHAYLFTGSRGTGKTSVARIFAKALGVNDIDIFEIDAASHTSVENMREIITSMYTQPVQSSHKVYIFDEVHMLSKSAFNAFLKTLEEPPEYTICILITTEVEKVPDTIISRCVPFDFHQPTLSVLKKSILATAKKEGRTLNEQSANLIALMSEGSFRDSLTSLQKILLISDEKSIAHTDVEQILGAPNHTLINDYITALTTADVSKGIDVLESVAQKNITMMLFAKLCVRKVRAALLLREGVKEVLEDYDDDVAFITELAENEAVTVTLLMALVEAVSRIRNSFIKSLPLEYLLIEHAGDNR